jgi:hypothetical protein
VKIFQKCRGIYFSGKNASSLANCCNWNYIFFYHLFRRKKNQLVIGWGPVYGTACPPPGLLESFLDHYLGWVALHNYGISVSGAAIFHTLISEGLDGNLGLFPQLKW